MRRRPGRHSAITWHVALVAGALLISLSPPAQAQDESNEALWRECLQEDVASFAVRACTRLLSQSEVTPADRMRLLMRRGTAWTVEDDHEAAAEDFTLALAADPGSINARTSRARAYDQLQRYDDAAADWSTLIARDSKSSALYRHRGASYLGAGKHAQALADYGASLQLDPKALDAYIGRALVYEAMGERDKALAEFDAAATINPEYLPLYWERARMADRWGERDLAIKNYINVLKINGHYANARKHLERLGVYSPY